MRHVTFVQIPVFLLIASTILEGCTVTREVGYGEGQTAPSEVVRTLTGREVTVVTDKSTYHGILYPQAADTIRIQSQDSASGVRIPLRIIRHIQREGSGPMYSLLGGAIGLGGGAGLGYLIGDRLDNRGRVGWGRWDPGNVGAVIGAFLGLVLGVGVGSKIDPAMDFTIPDETSVATLQGVVLRIQQLIDESGTAITFLWGGREVRLPKSQVTVTKEPEGGVSLRMSRAVYDQINSR